MGRLKKAVALSLLALMGLATTHCRLEQISGLEFLACCQHVGNAPHQDDDCDRDGCATVESGFYKGEEQPASAPQPLLWTSFSMTLGELSPANGLAVSASLSSLPAELPRAWQFFFRAALPPRAPSLAS